MLSSTIILVTLSIYAGKSLGATAVGRDGKSIGLYSSVDGTSYAWVNTSAATTAGFIGNAAVLLAGVYLMR